MAKTIEMEDDEYVIIKKNQRKARRNRQNLMFGVIVVVIFIIVIIIISTVSIGLSVAVNNDANQNLSSGTDANKSSEEDTTKNLVSIKENKRSCPNNWFGLANHCFRMFLFKCDKTGCPWDYSQQVCKSEGKSVGYVGGLAEPRDTSLLEALVASSNQSHMGQDLWLGLKYNGEDDHVWGSDGSSLSEEIREKEKLWFKGKPSYESPWVFLRGQDKLLSDDQSILPRRPVCQQQVGPTMDCQHPWKQHFKTCFRLMIDECPEGCSWEEARDVCEKNYTILAKPDFHLPVMKNLTNEKDNRQTVGEKINFPLGLVKEAQGNDSGNGNGLGIGSDITLNTSQTEAVLRFRPEQTAIEFLKNLVEKTPSVSAWWLGITDQASKNIIPFLDNKAEGDQDCLILLKDGKVVPADCNLPVQKDDQDFSPQPICQLGDKL